MAFCKLFVISLCLDVLLLSCCVATASTEQKNIKLNTKTDSNIYKIKRLDDITKDKHAAMLTKPTTTSPQQEQHQHQQEHEHQQQQQHEHQHEHEQQGVNHLQDGATKPPRTKKLKNLTKNSHGLNKKLLSKLGFTKVKAPNSHNRKRLAIESRHHASPDDSHMFIIKLPPNFYYYASPKEAAAAGAGAGGGVGGTQHNSLVPHTSSQSSQSHSPTQLKLHLNGETNPNTEHHLYNSNGKKVHFPFNSNGKPGRIYHWNLPAIKKILEDKQRFPNMPSATKDQLIDIKDIPTWTKPWENETIEKSYGKSKSLMSYKKSLKRKSPSYYAPANAVNKNSFNKYFPGNGKPKGFYVIKENQKKPLYYKNIVS